MTEFLIGLAVGWLVATLADGRRRGAPPQAPAAGPPPADTAPASSRRELLALATKANPVYEESATPGDLQADATFQQGVAIMKGESFGPGDLVDYYTGANIVLACMAVEALGEREDDPARWQDALVEHLPTVGLWTRHFVLRTLERRGQGPHLARVLARVDSSWDSRMGVQFLQEFLGRRVEAGEEPTFGEHLEVARRGGALSSVLEQMHGDAAEALRTELAEHAAAAPDVSFLGEFGRRLADGAAGDLVRHDALRADVTRLRELLEEGRRSVLVVGEPGVGKTATLKVLGEELHRDGWTVFEAGAGDVMAGQMYIGSLEGRLQKVLKGIGGRPKVLWIVPAFHELQWAGVTRQDPTSLLDLLFPHLESGAVQMVAETHPEALEQMQQRQPRLRTALHPVRLAALDEARSREVVAAWGAARALADGRPALGEEAATEAVQLAVQYLGARALPGSVLRFLDATYRTRPGPPDARRPLRSDDLLDGLTLLTGLPRSVLDHGSSLDTADLQRFFEERVLGQPEAVECLVDRVALVKSGLTDPGRPLGVFLFTGPTGTGKTELAKALAEYLFGSPDRMIRVDMSELTGGAAVDRLLGDGEEHARGVALVDAIRHEPFSVVLLDEFEKADARVHNLFLQLFDDGRLTDRRGLTADFRHAIVIMTSNLGGNPSTSASVGFRRGRPTERVDRAVQSAFTPEFVNRIDRVVAFRPLGRAVMRRILEKELADALRRRGLRSRDWAVEWEESAVDFLLRKGFTQDLGARPLRRAVERYLLSPLARTIVRHQVPEGEQFLFVSSDGHDLQVTFVDPDAPAERAGGGVAAADGDEDAAVADLPGTGAAAPGLEQVLFHAQGTEAEAALLTERVHALAGRLEDATWADAKQHALAAMEAPAFWEDPARFGVLGRIEMMDRIETGMHTATSLLERLQRSAAQGRDQWSPGLLRRLGQQVFLLEHACAGLDAGQPADSFVVVEALVEPGEDASGSNAFAARLVGMYEAWARRRGMRLEVLEDAAPQGARRVVLGVSGFGAWRILEPEGGLHVLEQPAPDGERRRSRTRVRVTITPQPERPAANAGESLAQAAAALAAAPPEPRVVRRYREEPSPLVRDGVRGWRTGLLDRVLDGEFDVVPGGA